MANERGLPDEPYFEAGGVYVAMLREPRARYLSQYLHLKQYGEAYLRVRSGRLATPSHGCKGGSQNCVASCYARASIPSGRQSCGTWASHHMTVCHRC